MEDLKRQIETLKKELKVERRVNRELEQKLFLFVETGEANINRKTFRSYVNAALNRQETDSEWNHFLSTFSYNSLPLSVKVYEWIDTRISHKKGLYDMNIDLESVVSLTSLTSLMSGSRRQSLSECFNEFKYLNIEMESWPSDGSDES